MVEQGGVDNRLGRIKEEIAELALRPNSVRFAELERIVSRLQEVGYDTQSKAGRHSHLLRVNTERVTVCTHNPKRKELKPVYVRNFLQSMKALGLLDDDSNESEK